MGQSLVTAHWLAARFQHSCQGKYTDRNHPSWPDTIVTICVSYFMMGVPSKEHGTNKPPPTGRIWERSKGYAACPTTSRNRPRWNPSWLSNAYTTRKYPKSEGLARDNPETNPITIKPETARHVVEQTFWFPLTTCSPPGCLFPVKSLA